MEDIIELEAELLNVKMKETRIGKEIVVNFKCGYSSELWTAFGEMVGRVEMAMKPIVQDEEETEQEEELCFGDNKEAK